MPDLPDVPPDLQTIIARLDPGFGVSNNARFMSAEEWFNDRFRKPNGQPYSPRTRKKHLKILGIEPLWVGWTPIVDPVLADRRVLEIAAEQSAKITRV